MVSRTLPITFGSKLLASGSDGSQFVSSEDAAPTFSCCTGLFTPAATPNDICFLFQGTYGRTLTVKRVIVSGISTSGGQIYIRLEKAGTGGVVGYNQPIQSRFDQNDQIPIGLVWQMTSNRTGDNNTLSSGRTMVAEQDITLGVAGTSAGTNAIFDFTGGMKCPTMKQITDSLAVNLNGQTLPAGTQLRVTYFWQEHKQVRIGAIGDSTTSNATNGYLNNGANNGGIGTSGLFNSLAVIDNLGSNGYRIWDFLNNTNGVTYPIAQAVQKQHDVWNLCYGINDVRTGTMGADIASCTAQLSAMLDTAVYGALNGATTGGVYVSPKAIAYPISSITWAGSVATVTTTGPHGFVSTYAMDANISGVTPVGYNTSARITVTGLNTFTYPLASNPGTYTSGGSVAFCTIWPATWSGLPELKIILWGPNCLSTDDGGDGPFRWLSAAGNTTLSGLWSGMTLAQAAQAASTILYNAYQVFAGDPRLYAMVQKQDGAFTKVCTTVAAGGLLTNQLHPNTRGQTLATRQIMPTLLSAISDVMANVY